MFFAVVFCSNQDVISQEFKTDDPFKKMFETKISNYHYGEHMMEHRLEKILDILSNEYEQIVVHILPSDFIWQTPFTFESRQFNIGFLVINKGVIRSKRKCFELVDRLSINLFLRSFRDFNNSIEIGQSVNHFLRLEYSKKQYEKLGESVNLFAVITNFEGNGIYSKTSCAINLSSKREYFDYR
jgi:hypothetical protein